MLKRVFVLALAMFTFAVAPTLPGLRTAEAAPSTTAPYSFEIARPLAYTPSIDCEEGKKCLVHHVLADEINSASVGAAIRMIRAADAAGADAFILELNTPGGSVPDGFELSKAIENAKTPITCVVDGDAASMGFYILQSCPVRVMTKRSTLMAHEPALGGLFRGQPNQWEAMAEMLKALRQAMAEHCAHRLNVSVDEYRRRSDGGRMWWFTWSDAVKFKAVDRVVGSVKEVVADVTR